MSSFYWELAPHSAYVEPTCYEYDAQKQFVREADKLISLLKNYLAERNQKYHTKEQSLEKAVWMLQVDAIEAIYDSMRLTKEKHHRLAGRLFRDVVETLAISLYFSIGGERIKKDLEKWYQNEVIPHKRYREFIRKFKGETEKEYQRKKYEDFSKYTHRTYFALSMSYILDRDDNLVFDGIRPPDSMTTPHVISFTYAVLAKIIKEFTEVVVETDSIKKEIIQEYWDESLEEEQVPRRFGFGPRQSMIGPTVPIG